MKKQQVPNCDKCKSPLVMKSMEAIIAPPAPTMYLKTYTCEKCHPPKNKD